MGFLGIGQKVCFGGMLTHVSLFHHMVISIFNFFFASLFSQREEPEFLTLKTGHFILFYFSLFVVK